MPVEGRDLSSRQTQEVVRDLEIGRFPGRLLPNLRSLTTSCVCLELRSLPSTGITGFRGTTNLSATPGRPACPSRASGWSSLTTSWGFPCCVRFPCVHAAATTPVQQLGVLFAHSPSRISLPRKGYRVGLHIVLFEACSAFTHVAACTLAQSPIRDPLIEGFSHFVSSMTAPIASGWSGCRVGLAPTGKRRLVTAHTQGGSPVDDGRGSCESWRAHPSLISEAGSPSLWMIQTSRRDLHSAPTLFSFALIGRSPLLASEGFWREKVDALTRVTSPSVNSPCVRGGAGSGTVTVDDLEANVDHSDGACHCRSAGREGVRPLPLPIA